MPAARRGAGSGKRGVATVARSGAVAPSKRHAAAPAGLRSRRPPRPRTPRRPRRRPRRAPACWRDRRGGSRGYAAGEARGERRTGRRMAQAAARGPEAGGGAQRAEREQRGKERRTRGMGIGYAGARDSRGRRPRLRRPARFAPSQSRMIRAARCRAVRMSIPPHARSPLAPRSSAACSNADDTVAVAGPRARSAWGVVSSSPAGRVPGYHRSSSRAPRARRGSRLHIAVLTSGGDAGDERRDPHHRRHRPGARPPRHRHSSRLHGPARRRRYAARALRHRRHHPPGGTILRVGALGRIPHVRRPGPRLARASAIWASTRSSSSAATARSAIRN